MATDTLLHLVGFKVGKELFAVPIEAIQEIIRMTEIVVVPHSPDFVEGVINLRGKVIPIIDLKKRFNTKQKNESDESRARIVVAEIGDSVAGLIVDDVYEVMRVEQKEFEETPGIVGGEEQRFIRGIVKQKDKMILVLELKKLLSGDEMSAMEKVK